MIGQHVWKVCGALLGIGAVVIASVFTYTPVFADTGLTVSGAKLVATASAGDTFIHQITVSIGSDDQPMDMTVQVLPMAQALDGTPLSSQEANPYSASSFITLDKDSFHLDPGGKQMVNATIRIPKGVGDGGRYALIKVATQPPAGSALSVITAVNIPIYITIKGSRLANQGKITSLSADVSSSQAIEVVSVFENTGNHDFKIKNNLTLRNSKGKTVASIQTNISLWTLIPGMSREIKADIFPEVDLSPGLYRVTSQITLDDGTILAEAGTDLQLITALSGVVPLLPTSAPSNSMPAVARTDGTNWVSVVLVMVSAATLTFIGGLFLMNILLRRPVTGPLDDKEVPSTLASDGGLTQQPAIFLDRKSITISYFLTVRNQIRVGGQFVIPKTGNVYLVVAMNIENHGDEPFNMHPLINTYAIIGGIKYGTALVLDLENRLPEEIVILKGDTIEGNLAFEVPTDVAINRCQMTYENSLAHNIEWICRNFSMQ